LNRLEQSKQRDSFEGIDPIEFARAKLAQSLRNVVKKSGDCGAVITAQELVETEKPNHVDVPEDSTVFAFGLRRNIERVFLIMFKNKPDGSIDITERAVVWQDGSKANQ